VGCIWYLCVGMCGYFVCVDICRYVLVCATTPQTFKSTAAGIMRCPSGTVVKNLLANAGDTRRGFNPWVMATHSSILAWRIPWTEEPGSLLSIDLQCRTGLSMPHHAVRMRSNTLMPLFFLQSLGYSAFNILSR